MRTNRIRGTWNDLQVPAPRGPEWTCGSSTRKTGTCQSVNPAKSCFAATLRCWNNPEASAAALRGGWLHTGDIGVFDEDGFVTLKDRSKDMIISGGSNIYPREIEEILITDPRVAEASVVGRPHADWGEEVVAFVVVAEGRTITAADLDELCLDNIARFKRPKDYVFVENLPKSNYGKILKTKLRERLARADSPA